MDTQQISAPSRAQSPVRGGATSASGGVVHSNARHHSHYTVIGNHLAQHRELTLLAVGLATHIQSLPAGARVGIKAIAERYPDSETRIAAGLRELEAHGYLRRTRERLPNGRVITRTVSYNQPRAAAAPTTAGPPTSGPTTAPEPSPGPRRPAPGSAATAPAPVPAPAPYPAPVPAQPSSTPGTTLADALQPHAEATASTSPRAAAPATPKPSAEAAAPPAHTRAGARAPLPRPQLHDGEHHRAAAVLLAGLRRHEPRMLLAEQDIRRLTPAVAAWLERDTHPDAVRHALTANLPESLNHPAALLAHRLTALLPPPLPAVRSTRAAERPDPLQNCDNCDHAFRAPAPGRCHACRSGLEARQATLTPSGRPARAPSAPDTALHGQASTATARAGAAQHDGRAPAGECGPPPPARHSHG
ncbi:hypothetical protein [Streptomyces sp. NBC_00344]|uniref:hypothetical protein n=1 Tax=Streptomyces sp. NBC_00344 TaxID=2975720 RepID=UPI002E1D6ACC